MYFLLQNDDPRLGGTWRRRFLTIAAVGSVIGAGGLALAVAMPSDVPQAIFGVLFAARGLTRRVSLGLLGALATPWLARAQSDYPSRIVKLIVPYAAGGSSDVVARFIAERMRDRLGQSIVIDNRPGAGAIIGSQFVAKSAPDGYTLLLGGVSTHAVNPHLRERLLFNRAFAGVGVGGLVVVGLLFFLRYSGPQPGQQSTLRATRLYPGRWATSSNSASKSAGSLRGS